ncbi:hypothetical protein IKG24_01235 [Candidatus Saccharibacteria bacterium]|nr:hypothetical protein [Candidatus Saccharibacteria bacterium]
MASELSYDQRRYYEAFLDFLQAVGSYLAIYKMGLNANEGVYPVQKIAYEYGYVGGYMDMEIESRNQKRYRKLDSLDYWSRRVGYLPLSPKDKETVMKFTEDADRRRYLRENVKREMKNCEMFSIDDLVRRRYAVEKKKRKKGEEGSR